MGYQAFKGDKFNITTPIPETAKIGVQPEDNKIKAMYNNLSAGTDQRSGVESFAEFGGSVSLAEGPKIIPKGMFEKAFTNLDKFVIPYSVVESIEEKAFSNAGILSFNDLSKVTKIGARAFEHGCLSGDFEILENVTEIGDEAFACNGKLTGFTVKGSTNCKIGEGIVRGCYNLEYLDLRNMNSTEVKNNLKNLSREFDTDANPNKTITAGLPTHTLVFLPDVADITFAEGQDVNFVKSDGTCTKLSLQDGAEYEFLRNITAGEVVYNRCNMIMNNITVNRGYNTGLPLSHYEGDNSLTSYRDFSSFADGKNCFTIFLPYAVKLPKDNGIRAYKLDKYGEDVQKNQWGEVTSSKEYYLFNSIPDGSELKANTPYLLRITNGGNYNSNDFETVNKPKEIAASGTDKDEKFKRLKPKFLTEDDNDKSYVFTGSTEKIPRVTAGSNWHYNPWSLGRDNDGKDMWKRMPDKTGYDKLIPPFRGCIMLKPTASPAREFVLLNEDNKPTSISNATENADAQKGAQQIYTIDGRYVGTNFDNLPSGMYIIQGKKILK